MENKCKMASMLKKISLPGDICITKGILLPNFSVFIIYQGLSFGGFSLKIKPVVSVYELII